MAPLIRRNARSARRAPSAGKIGPAGAPVLAANSIAALALTALTIGCGDATTPIDAGSRPLVLGYSAELQTLNPLVSTDQNANELIYYLLYTPLVVYDTAHRVQPWLAESWELDESGVTFTLRDDVRWHDGAPVTSDDVKFTFDLAKNPAVASPLEAAYLADVASAEVLEDGRIRFEFSAPHAQPLEDFFWPPVPRHLLADAEPADLARHPFGRSPTGSGPYRFVSWEVGEQLVFQRNDDFATSLGGPAATARVIYQIVPEPTTLLAEFLTGAVSMIGPLGPVDANRVTEAGERLDAFPWRLFAYIGWNGQRELFEEAEVRRALTMAIDRQELLDGLLYGYGTIASGVIPPWHPFAPDLEPLPYAPDSAAAILERHGWVDSDGDGIRDRNGRPFRFQILANQRNAIYPDMAQVVQAQLRRVGVDAQPRLLEQQSILSMHRARDFDAVLTNWVLDNFRVDPRPLFHSDQLVVAGSANRSSYSDPVADSLMDLGARTTDPAEAKRIWQRFSEVLQADQPFTFLYWQDELAAVNRELEGVVMDARGELVSLPRWRWTADRAEIERGD